MSDLSPGLIQRHRQWQADSIFEQKRHKGVAKRDLRALRAQIAERQKDLAQHVDQGSTALANYMRAVLGSSSELPVAVPVLSRVMTLEEFRDPTFEIEQLLTESMAGQIPRSLARQPAFWYACMAEWIEAGVLPANLHDALLVGQRRKTQQALLDHQTRNFIRRTGGIDVVRNRISVISDCPVSRAWWRRTVASDIEAAAEGEIDVGTAHRVLHANNDEWENFAMDALKRITVTSHPRLRAAVVCQFSNARRDKEMDAGRPQLQAVARELGRLGVTVSMQHIPWSEMRELAASAAATVGP